jgi:hypothetical protein
MNRPDWYLETTPADDTVIRQYAGDDNAFGTEHDMYVAYVVATSAIKRAQGG